MKNIRKLMHGLFVVLAVSVGALWCSPASGAVGPAVVIQGNGGTIHPTTCHWVRDQWICAYAYDTGTVTISAHGATVQTNWGVQSTNQSVGQALCSQMTSSFPVQCTGTATANGQTTLNLTDNNYYWVTAGSTKCSICSTDDFWTYVTNEGAMGHLNPKYIVMGVTYAPPGHLSTVTYGNSTMVGTSNTNSSSFKSGYAVSISIKGCTGDTSPSKIIPGFSAGVCVTGTTSSDYTQQSVNSNTITIQNMVSIQNKTTGTPDDFNPVNHDYDLVWLWLNPISQFSVWSDVNNVEWNGYGFDMTDQPAMDVWPVALGYLNGHFKRTDGTPCYAIDSTCDAEDARVLARSWAANQTGPNAQRWPTGEQAGLTLSDLAYVAKADPWGNNPSYAITLAAVSPPTTTDGRFTIVPVNNGNSQSFDYKQNAPGNGSGLTQTYTNQNTATNTVTSGNNYEYQQAVSVEVQFVGGFFWTTVGYDLKYTSTFTWDHSHMATTTNTNTSTDSLTITGPSCPAAPPGPCNPQYTGHPQFDVYQDNIFGSFAFWGVN